MLGKLYEMATQLVFLTRNTQENTSDIKALQADPSETRRELRDLAEAVRLLSQELEHLRESERHEREKLALAVENALLRFERRLPPPSSES